MTPSFLPTKGRESMCPGACLAHVLEHVPVDAARPIVESYLPCLKPGGRVVLITPQEAGQRSDSSHVHFFDLAQLGSLARALGLQVEQSYSFPFPRLAGRLFKYKFS